MRNFILRSNKSQWKKIKVEINIIMLRLWSSLGSLIKILKKIFCNENQYLYKIVFAEFR